MTQLQYGVAQLLIKTINTSDMLVDYSNQIAIITKENFHKMINNHGNPFLLAMFANKFTTLITIMTQIGEP